MARFAEQCLGFYPRHSTFENAGLEKNVFKKHKYLKKSQVSVQILGCCEFAIGQIFKKN
jgi:hypothetical protein